MNIFPKLSLYILVSEEISINFYSGNFDLKVVERELNAKEENRKTLR